MGLAYAWSAAERGHQVTVFERSRGASGASIRNFGMVWPIGQPAGLAHQTALLSRERWLRLGREAGIWVNPCGSIHLAHREDELAVIEEFRRWAPELGYDVSLLTPDEVMKQTPYANSDGLLGGLFSPTEACVNPPQTIRAIPGWLSREYRVEFQMNTTVTQVESGALRTASGEIWSFDRIIVCGGADFSTLFPELLSRSGLKLCKLQMLRTVPMAGRLGPHLASGLTLRHYQNFEVCTSLAGLKQRVAMDTPELDKYGIHVMASQTDTGHLILGDSHEYDQEIEPFDKTEVDELILRELQKVVSLPNWSIVERWHGIYAKLPGKPIYQAEPLSGVFVRTGTGGSGMTMSFGLAEEEWEQWS